jgi:hypothetical protein
MRYTQDMSRNKFELVSGVLLIIMPFLGFPSLWKTVVYIVVGCILIIVSCVGHFKRRSEVSFYDPESVDVPFVEHKNTEQHPQQHVEHTEHKRQDSYFNSITENI